VSASARECRLHLAPNDGLIWLHPATVSETEMRVERPGGLDPDRSFGAGRADGASGEPRGAGGWAWARADVVLARRSGRSSPAGTGADRRFGSGWRQCCRRPHTRVPTSATWIRHGLRLLMSR
jgi:hypothetical protein